MAKKKISEELQEAILGLPQKEKNKLLIRLINKDELLIEQLQYKLLEDTLEDLNFRIKELKENIDEQLTLSYFKELLQFTREKVALINRFQKVTKDKKGELELLVHLYKNNISQMGSLRKTLRDMLFKIKFKEYSLARIQKMKTLLEQIHEDYQVEYLEDIETIEKAIQNI